MSSLTVIWIFIGIAIIVFSLVSYYSFQLKRKKGSGNAYIMALEAIIDENPRVAIEKLKEEAKNNSDNVKAYLYMGDLLRSTGLYKNALKIHLELTYRKNITPEIRKKIYKALLKDYYLLEDWQNVIKMAKTEPDILAEREIMHMLFRAYEELEKWEDALKFFDKINLRLKEFKMRKALYKVFYGLQVAENETGHDARLIFKEALKIDPKCTAAYFSIAQTYFEENRLDDAIQYLKRLALQVPEQSFYAFKPLEETFLEKNEFPKVQSFYEELIKKFPDIIYPYYALANLHVKKGDISKAIELLNHFKNEHPSLRNKVNEKLFHLLIRNGDSQNALEVAKEIIPGADQGFFLSITCKNCGFSTNEPKWVCPQCHEYQSFTV
jgi:lipopolysaccharide biosynthesis regulator YciM